MCNEIDERECCGNGCVNCVLNVQTNKTRTLTKNKEFKKNLLLQYRKYKLIEKTEVLYKIVRLKFKYMTADNCADYILDIPPGQHIMMRAPDIHATADSENTKKYILRPYTPFWCDDENFEFMILVNLSPGGKMSKFIDNLKENEDCVEFNGPIGSYNYEPNEYRRVVMFSHGVAVAPMIRIINEILSNEDDMSFINFYPCFKNLQNVAFREQLHSNRSFWNFTCQVYLSQELCPDCSSSEHNAVNCVHFKKKLKYKETICNYRLTHLEIKQIFTSFKKDPLLVVIICGSEAFVNYIKTGIDKLDDINFKIVIL